MNRKLIIFIALAAVLAGTGVFLFSRKHKIRIQKESSLAVKTAELAGLQAEMVILQKKNSEMEAVFNQKITALEAQLKENEANAKSFAEKLEALEKEKSLVMDDNLEKSKSIESLTKRINELEAARQELLNTISALQEDKGSQQNKFNKKKEPENRPYGIRPLSSPKIDTVNLGKIVVQKSSGRAAQVIQVNSVYNFIVVNVGSRDGVESGSIVNLVREDRLIGKAVIQKVRDNISAAVLLPEWTQESIEAGDFVTKF